MFGGLALTLALAASPWAEARVGDRVELETSLVIHTIGTRAEPRPSVGTFSLEVLAVDGGVATVKATARTRDGQSWAALVEMELEDPPVEPRRRDYYGGPTTVPLAGESVACSKWHYEQRAMDELDFVACAGLEPPLYLSQGNVLKEGHGHHFSEWKIQLRSRQRGVSGAPTRPLPGLPRVAVHSWAITGGERSRTLVEERLTGGFFITTERSLAPLQRTKADVAREDLMHLPDGWYVLSKPGQPELRATLFDRLERVAALGLKDDRPEAWSAKYEGLPAELRIMDKTPLVRWGTGEPPGADPPQPNGPPDTLTQNEVEQLIIDAGRAPACFGALHAKDHAEGHFLNYSYRVELTLGASGAVAAVKATPEDEDAKALGPKSAACVERELSKLKFPALSANAKLDAFSFGF